MKNKLVNTGISLPLTLARLLRDAARGRQAARGGTGRASVSALLAEIVEKHETELQDDARRASAAQ